MSAFELVKGFTKVIDPDVASQSIQSELITARDTLLAKRKLSLITRTKATVDPSFFLVIYSKSASKKRNKKTFECLSPAPVLAADQ